MYKKVDDPLLWIYNTSLWQEHVIEEWGDSTPLLHNELIHHYRELVTGPIPASDPTSLEEVAFIYLSYHFSHLDEIYFVKDKLKFM